MLKTATDFCGQVLHFLLDKHNRELIVIFFTLLLPLGLILFNGAIIMNQDNPNVDPAIAITSITVLFMIAFQFFSGQTLVYHIYDDIRGDVHWRLLATPVPQRTFYVGAFMAAWAFIFTQGLLIIGVTTLIFDMRWGNPLVLIATLFLISLISQLLVVTISQVSKTRQLANGIVMGLGFMMMLLSNALFVNLGSSAIAVFFRTYGTPLALGQRAIMFSGVVETDMSEVMLSMGALAAIVIVLAGLAAVLGRRRRSV